MKTSDFDYTLPPELIAARPLPERDASRLLVLRRNGRGREHRRFRDLPDLLRPGDCLVLNDSRVIPARLLGRRATGGSAEVLLLEPEGEGLWRAMVRPARKLPPDARVEIVDENGIARAEVVIEEVLEGGERLVRVIPRESDAPPESLGQMPLPPYILAARRAADLSETDPADRERYQTVYAREPGSVAAPTAGLHFTAELLSELERRGVEIRRVTLHVGPGTFAPVKTDRPETHSMHRERFSVSEADARAIQAAIDDPRRRIVAVGTTVARVLESLMLEPGRIEPGESSTDLLILPGFRFRAVDALITNFHLPRSTLLMLVSAFAGRETVLNAYAEAVAERYRFYSYGDAMLIE